VRVVEEPTHELDTSRKMLPLETYPASKVEERHAIIQTEVSGSRVFCKY
jgi:hypothetical protein